MNTESFKNKSGSHVNLVIFLLIGMVPPALAILPWDFNRTLGTYSSLSRSKSLPVFLIELSIIFLALVNGFKPLKTIRLFKKLQKFALIILIATSYYTAFFVAQEKENALWQTTSWLIHFLFGLSIHFLAKHRNPIFLKRIWLSVIIGVIIYTLILVIFIATLSKPEAFNWPFRLPGVINVRLLGFEVLAGVCAAIGLAAFENNKLRLFLLVTASSITMSLGVWSGSRGCILAILISGIIASVFSPDFRKVKVLFIYLITISAGLFFSTFHQVPHKSFGITNLTKSFTNSSLDKYSSRRISIWQKTLEVIKERPILGYGEGQFRSVVPIKFGKFNQPHNSILQFVLQWGILGTACFIVLSFPLISMMIKQIRDCPRVMAPNFLIVCGLLFFSLYDSALYHPYPIMMISLSLGIAASTSKCDFEAVTSPVKDE